MIRNWHALLHQQMHRQTLRGYLPGGGTFLHKMTSWPPSWNDDIKSKIWLCQSTDEYLLEEQSCQISSRSDLKQWSLRLFWRVLPQQQEEQKMSSDMWSVPDLKIESCWVALDPTACINKALDLSVELRPAVAKWVVAHTGIWAGGAKGAAAPWIGQSNILGAIAKFWGQKRAAKMKNKYFFSIY